MLNEQDIAYDTIRLAEGEKRAFIDGLNRQAASKTVEHERRRVARAPFTPGDITVGVVSPAGGHKSLLMLPRNLSANGVAFIIGQFMYTDTTCEIMLPTPDDEKLTVNGTVSRCRHLQGMLHEVAILFKQPIDLANFIPDMPTSEQPEDASPSILTKQLDNAVEMNPHLNKSGERSGEEDYAAVENMLHAAQSAIDTYALTDNKAPAADKSALRSLCDMLAQFVAMIKKLFT